VDTVSPPARTSDAKKGNIKESATGDSRPWTQYPRATQHYLSHVYRIANEQSMQN
jgi:hypothetical protein